MKRIAKYFVYAKVTLRVLRFITPIALKYLRKRR